MANLLTKTFEAAGTDNFVSWFDAGVSRVTTDFHSGAACLQWVQLAQFSGVQNDNFPYFQLATAGQQYTFALWHKYSAGTNANAVCNITFVIADGTPVAGGPHLVIPMPYGTSWAQSSDNVTAPAGATGFRIEFQTSVTGGATILIDDITVDDVPQIQSEESKHHASTNMFALARW